MVIVPPEFDDEVVAGNAKPVSTLDFYGLNDIDYAFAVPFLGDPVIQVDAKAASRRTLTVDVPDVPAYLGAGAEWNFPLQPFEAEVYVQSGFEELSWYPNPAYTIPVGVFRVIKAEPIDEHIYRLTMRDRSVIIEEARHEVPYVIPGGTNLVTAMTDLATAKYPSVQFLDLPTTSRTVPLTVFEEWDRSGDPWQNLKTLAAAGGYEVFFGPNGGLHIRTVPDPTTDPPVWTHEPGPRSILLGTPANSRDSQPARNVAIAIGEGPDLATPIRGVAEITDPSSPLYPPKIGRRPIGMSSALIQTQAQADAAALALLQRKAGGIEVLSFTAVPHPAHDVGDVVTVRHPILPNGEVTVVLDSFALPLTGRSAVSYATQARRSAA